MWLRQPTVLTLRAVLTVSLLNVTLKAWSKYGTNGRLGNALFWYLSRMIFSCVARLSLLNTFIVIWNKIPALKLPSCKSVVRCWGMSGLNIYLPKAQKRFLKQPNLYKRLLPTPQHWQKQKQNKKIKEVSILLRGRGEIGVWRRVNSQGYITARQPAL